MIRQFWFRKLDVGYFTDDAWPHAAGLYSYKPLLAPQVPRDMWLGKPDSPGPSGHAAMQNALALGETPVCYYYTGDSRVFFTVRECPEAGVLSLSDFETEAWLLPTTIAQQLGGIYRELVDKQPFSEIARVPLAQAPASGRALRLVIWQCDAEVLFLVGISRRWWLADAAGLHPDGEWPLSDELLNSERGASENPSIKFATDGHRVRFGMNLGMTKPGRYWYASFEAPLGPDGRFIPDQLIVDRSGCA